MTKLHKSPPLTYHAALCEHLERPTKATLLTAFALGKAAFDGNLEIFDLISIHHQTLAEGVMPDGSSLVQARFVPGLESFLMEAIAPFRMASGINSGGKERMPSMRSEHVDALVLRNARLEEEIEEHQRTEVLMREAKDHYFQLYQSARTMEGNLRALSAQVLAAQENERKRISRELYDEIGQALIAVKVTIAMLKMRAASDPAFQRKVSDAEQLLAGTMETVQRFARELRPAMLDHLGLQSALRAHILVFASQTGIRTELVPHPVLARLDERREEVLFRVVQEALSNVFKHAGATTAKIEFTSTENALQMEIGDDGCAFNVDDHLKGDAANRLGLIGMQERVRHVNGSFAIESNLGSGTLVRVKIPLDVQPDGHSHKTGDGEVFASPSPYSVASLYEENICSPR
jgi:signal transduction histidine kinase